MDVFLSYQRSDIELAKLIATDLEAEGFSVFYDVRIPVGDSWDSVIERELNMAKAVVVVWTPQSRESPWVKREARYGMGKRILCPIIAESCNPPLEFSDIQAADLRVRKSGDRADFEWRRLVEAISACFKLQDLDVLIASLRSRLELAQKENEELKSVVLEKQSFIDGQQEWIDQHVVLLVQQKQIIEEKQIALDSLGKEIAFLKDLHSAESERAHALQEIVLEKQAFIDQQRAHLDDLLSGR